MMKKNWIGLAFVVALFACNSNNDTKDVDPAPNLTNVENVNGNMPDTNNSITLDNKQTTNTDSLSIADSTNKKP